MNTKDAWSLHAQNWSLVAPPLKPGLEDIRFYEQYAHSLDMPAEGMNGENASQGPRALLLGVTPEIALMDWPANTRLVAVDRSRMMIERVWPGEKVGKRFSAVQADWVNQPLASASCSIVCADGCFTQLSYPQGYAGVLQSLSRTLETGGLFIARFFVRPPGGESLNAIAADLASKRIGNFHILKFRLAMALQPSTEAGVQLASVWNAWKELVPDPDMLCKQMGWAPAVTATIDAYRDVEKFYTFPSLQEVRAVCGTFFEEIDMRVPAYPFGECCPLLAMRKK